MIPAAAASTSMPSGAATSRSTAARAKPSSSVTLDDAKARQAIADKVAGPLGIAVEEAAAGIIRLLEQNLLHAVEHISIHRGHNPQRFTLVAAGGAGPMHGASVARALGCRRVYVPRQAGAFCALGMLHSDVRLDYLAVALHDLDAVPEATLEAAFLPLEDRAAEALAAEGFEGATARIGRDLDLRYRGQLWSIRVAYPDGGFDAARIRAAFEVEHERQFGHIQPGGTIEVTATRVVGLGLIDRAEAAPRAGGGAAPEPLAHRPVYIDAASGWLETPVYAGEALRPGHALAGPLLVEEQTTTVFIGPNDRLEIDPADNIVIHIDTEGTD